jgi:hypothetical protein
VWSARFLQLLRNLGHQPVVPKSAEDWEGAEVAIVNLASEVFKAEEIVPAAKKQGIYVIAHAGHKESQLLDLGKQLDCDKVASNSEVTYKLEQLLLK